MIHMKENSAEKELKQMLREVQTMRTLFHPNMTCFRDVWRTQSHNFHVIHIVMSYADAGTLEGRISERIEESKEFDGEM
jgi:serine/threonine protein kinase